MHEITHGVWCRRAPHSFLGLTVGTRCTVVRLPSGGLFVHSPVALDATLKAEVDALGVVRHIVCPNAFHHLYAKDWTSAYPEAQLHGPASLHSKRKDLAFSGTLDGPWEGALVPVPIDGCMLDETLFVHEKTRTLISSDLTENFPSMDDWYTRAYLKVNGTFGKVGWPRVLRVLYRDREAAKRSLARLLEHDFDRLVLAHGELIESGAKDAIASTFTFLD